MSYVRDCYSLLFSSVILRIVPGCRFGSFRLHAAAAPAGCKLPEVRFRRRAACLDPFRCSNSTSVMGAFDTCPEIASDEDRPSDCMDEAGGSFETLCLISSLSPVAEDAGCGEQEQPGLLGDARSRQLHGFTRVIGRRAGSSCNKQSPKSWIAAALGAHRHGSALRIILNSASVYQAVLISRGLEKQTSGQRPTRTEFRK